jgi:hypothetical protein
MGKCGAYNTIALFVKNYLCFYVMMALFLRIVALLFF